MGLFGFVLLPSGVLLLAHGLLSSLESTVLLGLLLIVAGCLCLWPFN
jgi:fucose permease